MLLIGLREFALSCSSAFFGLCFRCASVNALFCRAKPPNASFFSIFTRALARGVLLNRRYASPRTPAKATHRANLMFPGAPRLVGGLERKQQRSPVLADLQ